MEEGTIVNCLVKVDDQVKKGDIIFEVETDKASVEVPSTIAGVVEKLHIDVGDSLATGSTVLTVADAEAASDGERESDPKEDPAISPTNEHSQEKDSDGPVGATTPAIAPPRVPVEPPDSRQDAPLEAKELVPAAPSVRRFSRV